MGFHRCFPMWQAQPAWLSKLYSSANSSTGQLKRLATISVEGDALRISGSRTRSAAAMDTENLFCFEAERACHPATSRFQNFMLELKRSEHVLFRLRVEHSMLVAMDLHERGTWHCRQLPVRTVRCATSNVRSFARSARGRRGNLRGPFCSLIRRKRALRRRETPTCQAIPHPPAATAGVLERGLCLRHSVAPARAYIRSDHAEPLASSEIVLAARGLPFKSCGGPRIGAGPSR
jgi:hypothetical protein